jgi:microcystin-dependent protein
LVAAGAAVLAGCSGHHVMRALPGVAPNSANKSADAAAASAADAIPQSVLTSPIIGEARRFDGAVAPGLWLLARGQSLSIAEHKQLFRILGTIAGGDGKTTFKLPNPKQSFIIAVAGTFPSAPGVLAQLGRHVVRHEDSLGEGARPVLTRTLSPRAQRMQDQRAAAVLEAQKFVRSRPYVGPAVDVRLSPELDARIESARDQARSGSFAQLSPSNRVRVEGLIDAVLGGRTTLYEAGMTMASALSGAEANALLAQHDATERALRSNWAGMDHPNPQVEAGRYVMDVGLSQAQRRALATMRQNG